MRGLFWVSIAYLFFFEHGRYDFLSLNLFLAYLPVELGFWLTPQRNAWLFYPLLIIWLLFLPNAPYLLTDLVHLTLLDAYSPTTLLLVNSPRVWFKFAELVLSVGLGTVGGLLSVQQVAATLGQRLHQPRLHFGAVPIILFLSAIGIYIGRFLRIHTVYLLMPEWIINRILTMWSTRMWIFTVIIFAVQMACYGLLVLSQQTKQATPQD